MYGDLWRYGNGNTLGGYYCGRCGAFVATGSMHWCSGYPVTPAVIPTVTTTFTVPCAECAENRKRIEALEKRLKALGVALADEEGSK